MRRLTFLAIVADLTEPNPGHFVELLGAQAALDFLAGVNATNSCFYAGTAGDAQNTVEWLDIPRGPFDGSSASKLNAQLKREILLFSQVAVRCTMAFTANSSRAAQISSDKDRDHPLILPILSKEGSDLTTPPHSDRLNHFGSSPTGLSAGGLNSIQLLRNGCGC